MHRHEHCKSEPDTNSHKKETWTSADTGCHRADNIAQQQIETNNKTHSQSAEQNNIDADRGGHSMYCSADKKTDAHGYIDATSERYPHWHKK